MATFSAVDAAISGVRLVTRQPRVVLVWGVIMTIISLLTSVVTIVTIGPNLQAMQNPDPAADPSQVLAQLAPLIPWYLLLLVFVVVYYGVLSAAVNRMVLRPEDKATFYLRFGGDELRLMGVMIIQSLAVFGVYLLVVMAVAILAGVSSAISPILGVLIGVLGGLAALAAMIFLLVRFSLAGAETFATGKINIFGTWRLSRGHFWGMLGAYLLALVVIAVTWILVFSIQVALMLALGGGFSGIGALFQPDMSSVASFFSLPMIAYTVLGGFFSAVMMMVSYSPAATIYRELAQPQTADVFG